ncbi:MAG: hypothetical protein ACOZCP_05930 [Pseudomonadota bacterium]
MAGHNNKLDPALLGKIVLARFLELPLKAFDRCVIRIESSTAFSALAPWVQAATLDGAMLIDDAGDTHPSAGFPVLGEVRKAGGNLAFLYHRTSYAREYIFDEAGLTHARSCRDLSNDLRRVLHRLRLVNSRNRLTHVLMQALLELQGDFLRSGDALALVSLTQAQLSERLRSRPRLPLMADAGRISRLVRGLSIRLADGKIVPLAALLPQPRQIRCHLIDSLIKKEKALIIDGVLARPLSDEALAETLRREYGVSLSRRTVADIRHQLAIPDWRRRGDRKDYLVATEGFSPLVPLTPQALKSVVPAHPGVYEIRSVAAGTGEDDPVRPENLQPTEPTRVVYIGSAQDLRKRLGDHLRGSSGNARLFRYLIEGAARVRFRVLREGWRQMERQLYRVFCDTFGAPPPCNRMSP